MTHPIIEGAYFHDLLEQGNALRRTLAKPLPDSLSEFARMLANPQPPFVLLTGMGSSFHALHPLANQLADRGVPFTMLETSELIYYARGLLGPNTLLIAVSQSGRSAEMIRLLQLNAGLSRVIGVTNDADSPLARSSDAVISIHAGRESSVSCKTYVATLLALCRLGLALFTHKSDQAASQAALAAIPDAVDLYINNWRDHVDQAQESLQNTRNLVLAGRGSSLATAGTGGLILKESARFPAEGMSAAAFRHGPLEMVNRHLFLLVFEGPERSAALNQGLVNDVQDLGGTAELVSSHSRLTVYQIPSADDSLRPILEILPVQMISLALAAREGFEAGAFKLASKITAVE